MDISIQQHDQLYALDELLHKINSEDVKAILEPYLIIDTLKGEEPSRSSSIVSALVEAVNNQETDISMMKADIDKLETSVKTLVTILARSESVESQNSADLYSVKSQLGIYT